MTRRRKPEPRLPDWYPLATYTRHLTDDDWLSEIWLRIGFKVAYENLVTGKTGRLAFADGATPEEVFLSLVKHDVDPPPSFISPDQVDYAESWPVREMTAFEAAFLAHLSQPDLTDEERRWASLLVRDPKKAMAEFFSSDTYKRVRGSGGKHVSSYSDEESDIRALIHYDVVGPRLPLMVNINLDDETLKLAFSVWLAGIRAGTGEQKTPISDKHLSDWRTFEVLQAFDLSTWNKITKAGYTEAFIAQAIWPDSESSDREDFVDRTERYRKVTKPKVARLFHPWEAQRLTHQLRLGKFLEKMVPEMKKGGTKKP